RQGQAMPPRQGQAMPPRQGQAMPPRQGQATPLHYIPDGRFRVDKEPSSSYSIWSVRRFREGSMAPGAGQH
ncbi:MAG: hypothetical protein ACWA5X_01095, partial [bacterium]